ncbi:hypothetical protein MMPV_003440 [Pyropia vietnamensis]
MPASLPPPLKVVSYTPAAPPPSDAPPVTAPHPLLLQFPIPPDPPTSVSASTVTVFAPSASSRPLTLALGTPTARRYEGPATRLNTDTRYIIARVNRRTGAVRLEGAAAAVVLRPVTGLAVGALPSAAAPAVPDDAGTPADRLRKRSELIATFGSKRSRVSAKTRAENLVTEEMIGEHDAKATASALKAAAAAAARASSGSGDGGGDGSSTPGGAETLMVGLAAGGNGMAADTPLLPPHNLAATSLDGAYPLTGLISPAEYDDVAAEASSLLERLDALAPGTGISSSVHPLYVFDSWSAELLTTAADAYARRYQRVMAALYVTYLCAFVRGPKVMSLRYQKGLSNIHGTPPAVVDRLLATFSEVDAHMNARRGARMQTDATRDRVMSWTLVAWLIAVDYAGEVEGIARALGLAVPKALLYCIALGCKVKAIKGASGEKRFVARLELPLVLGKMDVQRGRRPRRRV